MIRIITGAPLWVWPLLAFLIWFGVRNLTPRTMPVWMLAILPLVGLALLPARIMAAPDKPLALGIYVVGAAIAFAAGLRIGRTIEVKPDRSGGRVTLPGSPFTLVLGLSIFLINYAFGVAFGIDPQLAADPVIAVLPLALSGLLVGFMLGRQGALFQRYRGSA